MTATVRTYRQSDASAPTLTGQVGSLTALLDAVLVNGYGSMAGAGWTIGQTTTNKRQYINSSVDGTGFSIWIDDTGPGAGGAKEARASGFEAMTGLGVGTGQFPTTTQQSAPAGALVIRKSTTADSTARNWTIVADDTVFYLFAETGDQTAPFAAFPFMFGDIFSYRVGDAYRCMIIGRTTENTASPLPGAAALPTGLTEGFAFFSQIGGTQLSNAVAGNYIVRNYTGVGGSLATGKITDGSKMGSPVCGEMGYLGQWSGGGAGTGLLWSSEFVYPNGPDGGLYLAPIWITHTGFVRGYLKGLWCPLQHLPLNHNDTYSGTGAMAGKSFLSQMITGASTQTGGGAAAAAAQVHIETSNTWS